MEIPDDIKIKTQQLAYKGHEMEYCLKAQTSKHWIRGVAGWSWGHLNYRPVAPDGYEHACLPYLDTGRPCA